MSWRVKTHTNIYGLDLLEEALQFSPCAELSCDENREKRRECLLGCKCGHFSVQALRAESVAPAVRVGSAGGKGLGLFASNLVFTWF